MEQRLNDTERGKQQALNNVNMLKVKCLTFRFCATDKYR